MATFKGRMGERIAALCAAHLVADVDVPFTEIPVGDATLRFFIPKQVPEFKRGNVINIYFNEHKGTFSMFPSYPYNRGRRTPFIDVVVENGEIDERNNCAPVIAKVPDGGKILVVYLVKGPLVIKDGHDKIIYRGRNHERVMDEDFYIRKHGRGRFL